MVQHAREFADAKIPFIFDPGQALPMFSGPELMDFIDIADYVTVNDYEARMLAERTQRSFEELARSVKALIVTQGGMGSTIYADGAVHIIPSVKPERIADPTGLRRRLSRRLALRTRATNGLGHDRSPGQHHGRTEDRVSGSAKPRTFEGSHCRSLQRGLPSYRPLVITTDSFAPRKERR